MALEKCPESAAAKSTRQPVFVGTAGMFEFRRVLAIAVAGALALLGT